VAILGSCKKCGGCCRFFVLSVPKRLYGKKDIIRWLEFHGVKKIAPIVKEELRLVIPLPCLKLNGNLCLIHDRRPRMCRDFPSNEDQLLPGCGYYDSKTGKSQT
jgi:Fe-S-cluster containining protein